MGERDAISDGQSVRANAQADISPVEIFTGSSMLTAGQQGNAFDSTSGASPAGTNSFQFDKDGSITFLAAGQNQIDQVANVNPLQSAKELDEHSCSVDPGAKPVSKGKASIFSEREGTATGEMNDPNKFTAAHKSLPLNSDACVVRPGETEGTRVRINDRGPYVGGRVIDMTPVSAKHLDRSFTTAGPGLADVEVYAIKKKK